MKYFRWYTDTQDLELCSDSCC